MRCFDEPAHQSTRGHRAAPMRSHHAWPVAAWPPATGGVAGPPATSHRAAATLSLSAWQRSAPSAARPRRRRHHLARRLLRRPDGSASPRPAAAPPQRTRRRHLARAGEVVIPTYPSPRHPQSILFFSSSIGPNKAQYPERLRHRGPSVVTGTVQRCCHWHGIRAHRGGPLAQRVVTVGQGPVTLTA